MGLMQDIRPVPKKELEINKHKLKPELMRQVDINYLEHVDTSILVLELYMRGVPITNIFGRYYEFEQAVDGRTLTLEDAITAGYGMSAYKKEGDL